MARVTQTVGVGTGSSALTEWRTRIDVTALSAVEGQTRRIAKITLYHASAGLGGYVGIDLFGDRGENPYYLSDLFITASHAITFDAPGVDPLIIPGPNHSSNRARTTGRSSSPTASGYFYHVSAAVTTSIEAWLTAYGALTNTQQTLTTITLDDNEPPVFPDDIVTEYKTRQGVSFDETLDEAEGTPPLTYTLTGTPSDYSFDPDSRTLTGTPTAASVGSHTLTYTVTDVVTQTASVTITLEVAAPLVLPSLANQTASLGAPLSFVLPEASGGFAPYEYTLSGLPTGFTFDADSRSVMGRRTRAGNTTITYEATDDEGETVTGTFTLSIRSPKPGLDGNALYDTLVNDFLPADVDLAAGGGNTVLRKACAEVVAEIKRGQATVKLSSRGVSTNTHLGGAPPTPGQYTGSGTVTSSSIGRLSATRLAGKFKTQWNQKDIADDTARTTVGRTADALAAAIVKEVEGKDRVRVTTYDQAMVPAGGGQVRGTAEGTGDIINLDGRRLKNGIKNELEKRIDSTDFSQGASDASIEDLALAIVKHIHDTAQVDVVADLQVTIPSHGAGLTITGTATETDAAIR